MEIVILLNYQCIILVYRLIIRIRADDENALVKLGVKFGCSVEESFRLLQVARSLGLHVIGVRSV